jgi:hypothetical protein
MFSRVLPWVLFALAALVALGGWQSYREEAAAFRDHREQAARNLSAADTMARQQVRALGAELQKLKEEKARREKGTRK